MFTKSILTIALVLLTTSLAAPILDPNQVTFELTETGFPLDFSSLSAENITRLEARGHTHHCDKGVRVWGVRGSTAVHGSNPVATMAHEVASYETGSFGSDLPYPAASAQVISTYMISMEAGVKMLGERIHAYTTRCPNNKIALIGFSQGAQVVGDTLIGTNTGTGGSGLSEAERKNIVAVVTFGDPAFVPHLPWDVGTAVTSGLSARKNYQDYVTLGYASHLKSYCNAGDCTCASGQGSDGELIHNDEIVNYGAEALAWMKSTIAASTI